MIFNYPQLLQLLTLPQPNLRGASINTSTDHKQLPQLHHIRLDTYSNEPRHFHLLQPITPLVSESFLAASTTHNQSYITSPPVHRARQSFHYPQLSPARPSTTWRVAHLNLRLGLEPSIYSTSSLSSVADRSDHDTARANRSPLSVELEEQRSRV